MEDPLRADARTRAGPEREAAAPEVRNRAAPSPGGRARRDVDRADRGGAAPAGGGRRRGGGRVRRGGGRERRERGQRRPRRARGRGARHGRRALAAKRPGRHPPLPVPASDGVGEDDRRRRFRRSRPHDRRPDPHPPAPAGHPVQPRAEGRGLRRPDHARDHRQERAAQTRSDHDPDLRLVRAARQGAEPRGVPARDLRRGAHGARREDERRDPQLPGTDLHRHDCDRAADREAGLRRLPGLGRRPPARRRRPPRPDRAAPVPPRPARRGDQLGADRRRRLRSGSAGQGARPCRAQPGGCQSLPRPLRLDPRHRLRRRRRPRLQPRAGVPRSRPEGRGSQRPHAARPARRDPGRLRARRDRRARQRDAARRGLELTARDRGHAPRADRQSKRVYQQRIGRIMRLHPRKEAGVVVDFVQKGATHSDRVVTLHSLLGADFYREGARVTPAPRRRVQRRARRAVAGAVARTGHARRQPAPRRDPARVATRRPALSRRGGAALLGTHRRPPGPLRRPRGSSVEKLTARAQQGGARPVPLHLRRREPEPAAAADGALRPGRR